MTGWIDVAARRWQQTLLGLLAALALLSAANCKEEATDLRLIVTKVEGDVRLQRDSQERQLKLGDLLERRDVILTGKDSWVDLRSGTIGVLRLKAESRIEVADFERRLDIRQTAGRSLFAFEKLGGQTEVSIQTPTIVAAVRGTSFGVAVQEEDARVAVLSGAVEVQSGEQRLAVAALSEARSGGDRPLRSAALSREARSDLREIIEIESIGDLSEFAEIQSRLTDMELSESGDGSVDQLPPRNIREER
ncbi:MAG: FecR family protein [Leptospirales bacterium]|nr:FecR family protein [Leptospirales bacterium]